MRRSVRLFLGTAAALLVLCGAARGAGRTVHVHLLDGDDARGDGSYERPYKSWREALRHAGSGDTVVAKNGDYRKAGQAARWGGIHLVLTMADKLDPGDPRHPVPDKMRPETVGVYRYDPARPLTIRAETRHGVIIDSVRLHLVRGVVIDGFDINPNPYYTDGAGKKVNRRRNGVHGDSVYEPEDRFNRVKTNDPPGGRTPAWYDRALWTSYVTVRNCKVHYECPPAGCTPEYDPSQDDDRLYLVKFNQAHHITIEDNELYDGRNAQRKPAVDLPCVDDAVVRRNLIRNSHRGVVSKGGGRRVLVEANVFVDNSGAAFSGGSTDPDLFIDGRAGDPCSFARFESYQMTARDNLVVSTRPGERPVEPISIWAARDAAVVNNTFVGVGERGVLLVRPGNEVDSPAKGCGRSVRLTLTEGLTLRNNVFVLSGVVDETMLYQTSGEGVKVSGFTHDHNTFFNGRGDVPAGGLADPNREAGFSKADPLLAGGRGTDYASWMATARLAKGSPSRGRGVREVSERAQTARPQAANVPRLSNQFVSAGWSIAGGRLRASGIEDVVTGRRVRVAEDVFTLVLKDGAEIRSSEMRVVGGLRSGAAPRNPRASRLAERVGGGQLSVTLEDERGRVRATWRAELRNGSNYIRQEVTFEAAGGDLPVAEIRLVDAALEGARVEGTVTGSPVVAGNVFLGFEHPLSVCKAESGRATCGLPRELPLRAGAGVTYSSVVGVARPGQLRRDFLAYLERERAHPYRTFLHYNSWYDIGYTNKFDEKDSLRVINHFGRELAEKRGVRLNSFLFDDGWDDTSSLWNFHTGFPRGFTPLKGAAARYGAAPGVWMSPWGGYDAAKEARLKYGRAEGFEIRDDGGKFGPGFALSGPKYYARFREVCMQMIDRYGVNQFKIDGFGNANRAFPGSRFDSDFDAAINLVRELRARRPDLFVNLTVGTFPSPFWLRYGDSIWRGGEDHDFAGVGSDRQQWITYRDAETYKMTVRRGPLYPLNSLMLHGLIYAEKVSRSKQKKLDRDPRGDFDDEIKSYFGSGTHLQEMYVTPSLLSEKDWDLLAEAARWSRSNADVLVDTHWVGGDPAALEVYGWASWSPRKGILVLRNPSDRAQEFTLDVGRAFELPEGAARVYAARSPWRDEAGRAVVRLRAGRPHTFRLAPFEVLTLEASPAR